MLLTEHRNPDETDEGTPSGSSKWCIKLWCLNKVSEHGIQTQFKVCHCLVHKRIILTPWLKSKVDLWCHLANKTKINIQVHPKMPCWPGVGKLINLIPNHHTKITKFNAHHRFRVDHITGCNQTWKRDPSPPWRKGRGIGWLSAEAQKLYTPPHCWNGRRTIE